MLVCVFESEATTATLVSVVVLVVAAAVWFAGRHPTAALLVVWLTVLAASFGWLVINTLSDLIFETLGKAPTLTGRTDIWAALQPALDTRPTLGWGFQAFWTDRGLNSPVAEIEEAMNGFRPPDAHSTPIDIRLQMGWWGLALAAATFARAWWQSVTLVTREPGMVLAIPLLTAMTAIAFTESLGLYPMDFTTLIIMVIVLKIATAQWDMQDALRRAPRLA
jgi:O-antigen ligase